MLSFPDIAIIGGLALIVFGPEQLPKVMRKAGQVIRDVQNTSQSFIREMERAADDTPPYIPPPYEAPAYDDPYMVGGIAIDAYDSPEYAKERALNEATQALDVLQQTMGDEPASHALPSGADDGAERLAADRRADLLRV